MAALTSSLPHPLHLRLHPLHGSFAPPLISASAASAAGRKTGIVAPLLFSPLPQPPPSPSSDQPPPPLDMERYLSDLSLEYDSVWDTKPAWCQPWTIILTGSLAVSSSWFALHSVPITAIASLAIAAWWYIFLYSYPQAYSAMIAERRRRVSDGEEDTYGFKISDK